MLRRKSSDGAGLRTLLAEGSRLFGTFVKLAVPEAVDIVASAGFDFALIDLEHSQMSEGDALRSVHHAFVLGLPCLARVPECDPGQVNRLLEAGASGIQLSAVRTVSDVDGLVAATRYAPHGRRSVSLASPAADYGAMPLSDAVSVDPPLLVGQIETAETDDPLKDILSAGLDVAFLGVTDLTVEMGFDAARIAARVQEVSEAAEAGGIALGAYAADPSKIPDGARYIALSSDLALLREAAGRIRRDAG